MGIQRNIIAPEVLGVAANGEEEEELQEIRRVFSFMDDYPAADDTFFSGYLPQSHHIAPFKGVRILSEELEKHSQRESSVGGG